MVLRIGDRFAVERLRVRANGFAPLLEIVGILDERDFDAQLTKGVMQEVVRAAVQVRAGDDVVAGLGDVEDRDGLGGLTRGEEECGDPAFEGSECAARRRPVWDS